MVDVSAPGRVWKGGLRLCAFAVFWMTALAGPMMRVLLCSCGVCRAAMSLVFDEFGRPFILMREQESKSRIKGLEAQKVN